MSTHNASIKQVIETTLHVRGKGDREADPMRVVRQYWSPEGDLLAESDPCQNAHEIKEAQIAKDYLVACNNGAEVSDCESSVSLLVDAHRHLAKALDIKSKHIARLEASLGEMVGTTPGTAVDPGPVSEPFESPA